MELIRLRSGIKRSRILEMLKRLAPALRPEDLVAAPKQ